MGEKQSKNAPKIVAHKTVKRWTAFGTSGALQVNQGPSPAVSPSSMVWAWLPFSYTPKACQTTTQDMAEDRLK